MAFYVNSALSRTSRVFQMVLFFSTLKLLTECSCCKIEDALIESTMAVTGWYHGRYYHGNWLVRWATSDVRRLSWNATGICCWNSRREKPRRMPLTARSVSRNDWRICAMRCRNGTDVTHMPVGHSISRFFDFTHDAANQALWRRHARHIGCGNENVSSQWNLDSAAALRNQFGMQKSTPPSALKRSWVHIHKASITHSWFDAAVQTFPMDMVGPDILVV